MVRRYEGCLSEEKPNRTANAYWSAGHPGCELMELGEVGPTAFITFQQARLKQDRPPRPYTTVLTGHFVLCTLICILIFCQAKLNQIKPNQTQAESGISRTSVKYGFPHSMLWLIHIHNRHCETRTGRKKGFQAATRMLTRGRNTFGIIGS